MTMLLHKAIGQALVKLRLLYVRRGHRTIVLPIEMIAPTIGMIGRQGKMTVLNPGMIARHLGMTVRQPGTENLSRSRAGRMGNLPNIPKSPLPTPAKSRKRNMEDGESDGRGSGEIQAATLSILFIANFKSRSQLKPGSITLVLAFEVGSVG